MPQLFRNCVFTLKLEGNPPPAFNAAEMRYLVFGVEEGKETGYKHYQGYAEFWKQRSMTQIRGMLGQSVHVEKRMGPQDVAVAYCKKDGKSQEFGVLCKQGERVDLKALVADIHSGATSLDKLILENPAAIHQYGRTLSQVPVKFEFKKLVSLRPWQADLLKVLESPPDDRTIYWVYDPEGGKGKTVFTKHLIANYGACMLSGKTQDMAHAYRGERIVIFDLPRSSDLTFFDYRFAEKVKDGVVFSGKYESKLKIYDWNPHVIVFSNETPDPTKWSKDKLHLINL